MVQDGSQLALLFLEFKGQEDQITFIFLQIYTLIYVFMGNLSKASFYQLKKEKISQILYTGSITANFFNIALTSTFTRHQNEATTDTPLSKRLRADWQKVHLLLF